MPKVSVIVPVYNVEKYIEQCARSLFEQTLDDLEFIFIDDCSPDNSMNIMRDVLKEYPNRQKQVIEISHLQNQGQAGARTSGMKAMTGDYMIHCDPDDWVEPNMYETLFNAAIETDADIVTCELIKEFGNHNSISKSVYASTPIDSIKQCLYTPSLTTKLIRSQLIKCHNIYPFPGINCGEDLNVVIRVFYFAKSILPLSNPLYHYRIHANSITHKSHKETFIKSHIPNTEQLCEFLDNTSDNFTLIKNYIKFMGKYGLLNDKCKEYKLWCKSWPECHRHIKDFPHFDNRYKFFMRICCHNHLLLRAYYKYLYLRTKNA